MSSFTPINNRNTLPSFQQMASAGWDLNNVSETTNASTSAMSQQTTKKFICGINSCDKEYTAHSSLVSHQNSAHSNMRIPCSYDGCNESFTTKSDSRRHEKSIHEQNSYFCGINGCEKSYPRLDNLKRHQKSHS